eukprot:1001536-Lingulodinium_polyedra.AAC.1
MPTRCSGAPSGCYRSFIGRGQPGAQGTSPRGPRGGAEAPPEERRSWRGSWQWSSRLLKRPART